jgi:hypothetical protein
VSCRSGCPTQDHANWGECARAAAFQIGDLSSGVKKETDTRLAAYASARKQGLQPPTTKLEDVQATMKAAGA